MMKFLPLFILTSLPFFISSSLGELRLDEISSANANSEEYTYAVKDQYHDLPSWQIHLPGRLKTLPSNKKTAKIVSKAQKIMWTSVARTGTNESAELETVDEVLPQIGGKTLNDTEMSPQAVKDANDTELATQAVNDTEMATQAINNTELATQTVNNTELATQVVNEIELATQAINNTELVTQAAKGTELPSQAFNDTELAEEVVKKEANTDAIIGNTKHSRNEVTDIGDVDENGYNDYIVAKPYVQNRTGSIRIYLMTEGNKYLFSRELVPGKWGFEGYLLKPGDLYGSAIYRLPKGKFHIPCIIAVGAPGDSSGKGAVYFLRLTESGTVSSATKISATTEHSLARQHEEDEGFGSHITAIGDLNGDGDYELSVKSTSGAATVLFMNSLAKVKVGLKVHKTEGIKDLEEVAGHTESPVAMKTKSLSLFEQALLSVRPAVVDTCFFNDTSCSCRLKSPESGSLSCVDFVRTEWTGKNLCRLRDCAPSYQCSCDGSEFCQRTTVTRDIYVADGSAPGGLWYCSKAASEMNVNILLEGVPVPTPRVTSGLEPYNSTHCRCSLKRDVFGPSECLDFLRTVMDESILCSSRECLQRDDDYTCDWQGDYYCSRAFLKSERYVDDGATADPNVKYCHSGSHTIETISCRDMDNPLLPKRSEEPYSKPAPEQRREGGFDVEKIAPVSVCIKQLQNELEQEKEDRKNDVAILQNIIQLNKTEKVEFTMRLLELESGSEAIIHKKVIQLEKKCQHYQTEIAQLNQDFIDLTSKVSTRKWQSKSSFIAQRLAYVTKTLAERNDIISALEDAMEQMTTDKDRLRRQRDFLQRRVIILESTVMSEQESVKAVVSRRRIFAPKCTFENTESEIKSLPSTMSLFSLNSSPSTPQAKEKEEVLSSRDINNSDEYSFWTCPGTINIIPGCMRAVTDSYSDVVGAVLNDIVVSIETKPSQSRLLPLHNTCPEERASGEWDAKIKQDEEDVIKTSPMMPDGTLGNGEQQKQNICKAIVSSQTALPARCKKQETNEESNDEFIRYKTLEIFLQNICGQLAEFKSRNWNEHAIDLNAVTDAVLGDIRKLQEKNRDLRKRESILNQGTNGRESEVEMLKKTGEQVDLEQSFKDTDQDSNESVVVFERGEHAESSGWRQRKNALIRHDESKETADAAQREVINHTAGNKTINMSVNFENDEQENHRREGKQIETLMAALAAMEKTKIGGQTLSAKPMVETLMKDMSNLKAENKEHEIRRRILERNRDTLEESIRKLEDEVQRYRHRAAAGGVVSESKSHNVAN